MLPCHIQITNFTKDLHFINISKQQHLTTYRGIYSERLDDILLILTLLENEICL